MYEGVPKTDPVPVSAPVSAASPSAGGKLGDAEIENLDDDVPTLASFEKNIVGLQVTVNDTSRVRRFDGVDRGKDESHDLINGNGLVTFELSPEGFADEKVHHHHRHAPFELEHVAHFDDTRMPNEAHRPRLAEEPLTHLRAPG